MRIQINNQNFTLHPSGAAFWEERRILLISDLHLGKVAHFRKHGIAIPQGPILENFNQLNCLLELFDTEVIIFLGDLFHSSINYEFDFFSQWVKSHKQEIILIEGNHDIISKQEYTELNINIYTELILDNFLLTHHPNEKDGFFNFCGHLHPGIKLKGLGKQFMNLACFFRKKNQMIFPAFGQFTGNFYLIPTENDSVYAITKQEIIEVNRV